VRFGKDVFKIPGRNSWMAILFTNNTDFLMIFCRLNFVVETSNKWLCTVFLLACLSNCRSLILGRCMILVLFPLSQHLARLRVSSASHPMGAFWDFPVLKWTGCNFDHLLLSSPKDWKSGVIPPQPPPVWLNVVHGDPHYVLIRAAERKCIGSSWRCFCKRHITSASLMVCHNQ